MKGIASYSTVISLVLFNLLLANHTMELAPIPPDRNAADTRPTAEKERTAVIERVPSDRPLFVPGRRHLARSSEHIEPVEEAPREEEANEPVSRPKFRLLGTRVIQMQPAALIVAHEEEAFWLPEGADIDGWTLTSIESDKAVLTLVDQVITLEFDEAKPNEAGPDRE